MFIESTLCAGYGSVLCECMRIYVFVEMGVCVCMHIQACIYTHVYMCVHVYMNAYVHVCELELQN